MGLVVKHIHAFVVITINDLVVLCGNMVYNGNV